MASSCAVQVKLELGHRAQVRKKPTVEGFTHDWMVFVRGPEHSNIQHFVEKVVFHLHESFPRPKRGERETLALQVLLYMYALSAGRRRPLLQRITAGLLASQKSLHAKDHQVYCIFLSRNENSLIPLAELGVKQLMHLLRVQLAVLDSRNMKNVLCGHARAQNEVGEKCIHWDAGSDAYSNGSNAAGAHSLHPKAVPERELK
ncbi:Protein AF-9 [Chelonia mydas]|uniref:Protein AF-9 n=1 Tax=Chelonia mydas TaxID=8469 RepID=M7B7V1_CHEMY|nr:Protein AF-9 [Chelonia mydas]